jgi:hypothetical protein
LEAKARIATPELVYINLEICIVQPENMDIMDNAPSKKDHICNFCKYHIATNKAKSKKMCVDSAFPASTDNTSLTIA